jgi:uncharacterized protein (AIM24 family)
MATPRPIGARQGTYPDGSFRAAPSLTYRVEGELAPLLVVELQPEEWIWFDQRFTIWKRSDTKLEARDPHLPGYEDKYEHVYLARVNGPASIGLGRLQPGRVVAIELGPTDTLRAHDGALFAAFSTVRPLGPEQAIDRSVDVFAGPGIAWLHAPGDIFEVTVERDETFDLDPAQWLYTASGTMQIVREHLPSSNKATLWARASGPARVGFHTGAW